MTTSTVIYLLTLAGYAYAGKRKATEADAWPGTGIGPLPCGYAGSGKAWQNVVREHGSSNIRWRVLRIVPSEDRAVWAPVEQRAIRAARVVFGERCVNVRDGGHGFTSADIRRMFADPVYHARVAASNKVNAAAQAAAELDVAHALHPGGGPVMLPKKPAGFRSSRWVVIQRLAEHFGSRPFTTSDGGAALGISAKQVQNAICRSHVCEKLSARVWRINSQSALPQLQSVALGRARASLGQTFTCAQWEAMGKSRSLLFWATSAGLLIRVSPGVYRFPAATYSEHTARPDIAAE